MYLSHYPQAIYSTHVYYLLLSSYQFDLVTAKRYHLRTMYSDLKLLLQSIRNFRLANNLVFGSKF